ncbi:hypothetical protein ACLB1G_18450 [Oxalobacteraceae bacterium A2-2]
MTDADDAVPAGDDSHARIIDYWNRRPALSREEWGDFYQRAVRLLMRTQLPEDYRSDAARRDLINCFFQDKILLNAETSRAGPLHSAYALHGYLKNYEKSLRRDQPADASLDQLCEEGYQLPEEEAGPQAGEAHAGLLAEAGIDPRAAMHSADRFIAGLGARELAYLRHHSCAEGRAEPVSSIAQRLALGSTFHLRAKKLGITRAKGDTYRGYENTAIGGWLRAVGAQLHPDWREELAALLVLLCRQVRLRAGEAR